MIGLQHFFLETLCIKGRSMMYRVVKKIVFRLSMVVLFTTQFVLAQTPPTDARLAESIKKSNAACIKCHKQDKEKMLGIHAEQLSPNTNAPISCRNCHGNTSPSHRNGVKDVMKFESDIFKEKQLYRADEQNGVCFSCHEPQKLQAAFWPHDVHANKISCTACHQLHPQDDTVLKIEKKDQPALCVSCHQKQHDLKAKE